jgi:pyruvate/2-oxoglutarate dehydrogenase complex dihydrolipoamide acyltransferase (E2) component
LGFSPRIPLYSHTLAVILAILFGGTSGALADPQAGQGNGAAVSSAAGDAQTPAPTGNFFSSLKQAFKQDLDREVVRGHFDVGSPPDVHRYYCLVDAKTGKGETNGVAGEPVLRPDGMTGIKAGAVSFYTCATAEQQGILVTTGYTLTPGLRSKAAAAPPASPAPPPAAPPASPAPSEANAPETGPVGAPAAAPPAATMQTEIIAVYARFIAGQNAHDRAVVSDVLLDSKDFVLAPMEGNSVWGHKEAMDALQDQWKGTSTFDLQLKEVRIASVAPNVAVLITPLLFTQGGPGEKPSTVPVRWSGVFVKTSSGWHISSIFITPFKSWKAQSGS